MKRLSRVLLKMVAAMAVLTVLFASAAMAQTQEEDAEVITCTRTIDGQYSADKLAQTFVAHRSGYLTGIEADLAGSETSGVIAITTTSPDGKPTDSVLASGTYNEPAGGASNLIDWNGIRPDDAPPTKLTAGERYAIVVDTQVGTTYWNKAKDTECEGGAFYRTDDGTWQAAPITVGDNDASFRFSVRIDDDETAPTGTIRIDSGARQTADRLVQLELSAQDRAFYADAISGVTQMRFSDDGITWSEWESFAATKSWTLSGSDGEKTVYVQYRDKALNVSAVAQDTIELDTSPETTINSGPAAPVSSTAASFSFSSSEPDSTFRCSLDGSDFAACTSPVSYSGLSQGSHTLQVVAIDALGNSDATPASSTWFVDTVAPSGTIKINGGDTRTTSPGVTLDLSASDPAPASEVEHMRFKNEGKKATWSGWFDYSTSQSGTLSTGAGKKTVYVQYEDRAHNVSAIASDSINYIKP